MNPLKIRLLSFITLSLIIQAGHSIFASDKQKCKLYEVMDIELTFTKAKDPFGLVLKGQFTGPNHEKLEIPGFPNIVWDISKEALSYGRCDMDYVNERIERVRKNDTYKWLLTVHDYGYCQKFPEKVDFISIQTWQSDLYNRMRDLDELNDTEQPKMEYYKYLSALFERYDYSDLSPVNRSTSGYCLSDNQDLYMYFIPSNNYAIHTTIKGDGDLQLKVTWFNPLKGEYSDEQVVENSGWKEYIPYWKDQPNILILEGE